jgi:beta-fructofuranosidase
VALDVARQSILATATVFLPFDSLAVPPGWSLSADPSVRAGVELSAEERAASHASGGDGQVVDLNGGTVTLNAPGAPMPRRTFSFCLRVRLPAGDGPVISELEASGVPCFRLSVAGGELLFELFTDHGTDPLHMSAPFSTIGPALWHDLIGRYTGPSVELFVDGVLADEEWPLGAVGGSGSRTLVLGGRGALSEAFDHLALWDRALEDAEIAALGAAPCVPDSGSGPVQYCRAPGGGYVGDCFPFFHDGVYHFYYLFDRRHHASKFGLGAHQWAHASSRDMVSWDHHPLAVPITEEREGSICTGSVFFHGGTWYAFYATRFPDRSEHLSLAVGTDGISFAKTEPNPFASPLPPYRRGPFRDPFVFQDPRSGLFHMIVTAELANPPAAGRGGCLAHLTSSDLLHWEQREPFLVTGYGDQPECSELFEWHGWYYLVFSCYGVAHYRIAHSPFGPWVRPRVDTFDGPLARVMKSAPFTRDRRIGAFFLAEGAYAGRAVFREIIQHDDGTLGSSWPREMVPPCGATLSPRVEALGSGVSGELPRLRVDASQGFSAAALPDLPRRYLFSASVRPERSDGAFGIGVRGAERFRDALMLDFQPSRRRVGWRHPSRPSWQEEETAALYEVDGLERPFTVELVVLDDVLDVCIGRRRTLIAREAMRDGDWLFLYCHDAVVEFDEILMRELADS